MQQALLVIDDFFKNPQNLSKEASELFYSQSDINYSNLISGRSKYATSTFRRLQKFSKKKILWDKEAGTFRQQRQNLVDMTKNAFYAHSDGINDFVCLSYLSPPEDCHGGTGFYTHIQTGLAGFHDFEAVNKVMKRMKITFDDLIEITNRDARDPSKWLLTDTVQMKFNRMIIYNGRRFHSHIFDFSKVKKGSIRLTFLSYGTT